MARVENTSLFSPATVGSDQGNMSAAKLLGRRTHQMPGRMNVSELFFEVPKDYSNPRNGSLRLFARSVERFEKPVDPSKKEVKQPPWCMGYSICTACCTIDRRFLLVLYLQGGPGMPCKSPQSYSVRHRWAPNAILDMVHCPEVLLTPRHASGRMLSLTRDIKSSSSINAVQA